MADECSSNSEAMKKAITDVTKPVWGTHGPAATKVIAAVRSAFKAATKQASKQTKKGEKGKDKTTIDNAPPLAQKCIDVLSSHAFEESEAILSTDSLRMKPGHSKFTMTRAPKQFVSGLDKIKAVKSQMKWLGGQIQKDKMTTAITAFKPPVTKSITNLCKEHMPKRMSDNVALPSDYSALSEDIFLPQAMQQKKMYVCVCLFVVCVYVCMCVCMSFRATGNETKCYVCMCMYVCMCFVCCVCSLCVVCCVCWFVRSCVCFVCLFVVCLLVVCVFHCLYACVSTCMLYYTRPSCKPMSTWP